MKNRRQEARRELKKLARMCDEYNVKILVWDIETSHTISAHFGHFNVNIPHGNILQDWNIFSVSYKFLGKSRKCEHFQVSHKKPSDDFQLVVKMHQILNEVDVIIHHNGDKFDWKKFNARAIYHGLSPIKDKPVSIDTLKIAKKHFAFSSNRLDYIGNFLGVGHKLSTTNSLWLQVLSGDKKSLRQMVKYCNRDVILLEDVFALLYQYVNVPLLESIFAHGQKIEVLQTHCRACGSSNIILRGKLPLASGRYKRRYQCNDCGKWGVGKNSYEAMK